jgi:hypothetical protein
MRFVTQRHSVAATLGGWASPAAAIPAADVNSVLDAAAASGSGRGSVDLTRQHLNAVFVQLCREGAIAENPVRACDDARFGEPLRNVERECEMGLL